MPKQPHLVQDMLEFLEKMYVSRGNSGRKYRSVARYRPPNKPYVRESFDDGKGHSGAFTSEVSLVDLSVFNEALRERYITGLLMPGYVSKNEFRLTDHGKNNLFRLQEEKRVAEEEALRSSAEEVK